MSHIQLNSYASRIFENHPLAVWGLDDNVHYVSAIGSYEQDFLNWQTISCSAAAPNIGVPTPDGVGHAFSGASRTAYVIPTAGVTSFSLRLVGQAAWGDFSSGTWQTVDDDHADWQEVLDDAAGVSIDLDNTKKSMCVSFFTYAEYSHIDSYTISITYTNSISEISETQSVDVPFRNSNEWQKILGTFDMREVNDEGFYVTITVNLTTAALGSEVLFFNGLNIGQWSETFCHTFDGITDVALSSEIETMLFNGDARYSGFTYYPLASMFGTDDGYVFVQDKRLLAQHDGIPLVYGSINATCLYASTPVTGLNAKETPSIIIPANGFLVDYGRYNDGTMEFWLRANCTAEEERRIFGPVNSDDGLYVEEGYLSLKVGDKRAWHYVGKWYRPMLLSIRYSSTRVSLLVNGEQVMLLNLSADDIDGFTTDDWLGFYAYDDVQPYEIDCIAFYPYYQDPEVAKKDYVYGQGVQKTNIVDESFLGKTIQFDFPFAKYAVDFKYPDIGKWKTGFHTNLVVNERTVSIPNYPLPTVTLLSDDDTESTTTEEEWYGLMAAENVGQEASAVAFRFDNLGSGEYGYVLFPTLNVLSEAVESFYVTAALASGTLFVIKNATTNSYVRARISGSSLVMSVCLFGGTEEDLYSMSLPSGRQDIGLHLRDFAAAYSSRLGTFFRSPGSLALYVGGWNGNVYPAKIYNVHFNNNYYTANYVDSLSNGVIAKENDSTFISNYTLTPIMTGSTMTFDIAVSGYWKSAVPLAFFAKYVKNTSGQRYYDLDLLQLNIDVPIPPLTPKDTETLTYEELVDQSSEGLDRSYSWLNNYSQTGTELYEYLGFDAIDFHYLNADADIKPYVTFQENSVGVLDLDDYDNLEAVGISRTLVIDNYDWATTKFAFIDGTVIYPPKEVNFVNILMCFHIKFEVRKTLGKSISLRRLEASSIAVDTDDFYRLGTKYGVTVYPFSRIGDSYLPKPYNPVLITKDSSPYLYLTRDSGIQVLPSDTTYERGVYVPINNDSSPDFQLGGIRLWCRYDYKMFPASPMKIFEIHADTTVLYGYLVRDYDAERAKLYVLDRRQNAEFEHIRFVQEDLEVFRPVLFAERWTSISIVFGKTIDLSNIEGKLLLMPGVTFQNLGIFENSNEAVYSVTRYSTWLDVRNENTDWSDVEAQGEWRDIYRALDSEAFYVDSALIYKSLIGTQSVVSADDTPTTITPAGITFYQDMEYSSYILRPGEPVSSK